MTDFPRPRSVSPPEAASSSPTSAARASTRTVTKAEAAWLDTCRTCNPREPDDLCGWHHRCDSENCRDVLKGEVFLSVEVFYDDRTRDEGAYCNAACYADAVRMYHEKGWQDHEFNGALPAVAAVLDLVTNEPKSELSTFEPKESE